MTSGRCNISCPTPSPLLLSDWRSPPSVPIPLSSQPSVSVKLTMEAIIFTKIILSTRPPKLRLLSLELCKDQQCRKNKVFNRILSPRRWIRGEKIFFYFFTELKIHCLSNALYSWSLNYKKIVNTSKKVAIKIKEKNKIISTLMILIEKCSVYTHQFSLLMNTKAYFFTRFLQFEFEVQRA